MDIFQIFGDYIQLLGMIILLVKLCLTKNCTGISGKTQLLYAMVFTTRYADLTIRYVSLYNTILKIVFISVVYCTVLSIFLFFRKTYDRKHDAFRIELLILPCAVLALFMNNNFETIEVFWTFSVYLEAVAIVPQVYFVSKCKQVESIVISYVSCLGLYRGCYLMHWIYAYFKLDQLEKIAIASGIIQLIFYCDFFARNLPILKPKNSPGNLTTDFARQDSEAAVTTVIESANSDGDKVIDTRRKDEVDDSSLLDGTNGCRAASSDRLLALNCKNINPVAVTQQQQQAATRALAEEYKVALLTLKEQGMTNS